MTTTNANHSTRSIDTILDRLEKAHGLSDAGKDWLICASDPFHDFDLPLAGYPDVSTDASIVQLVKKQFVVSKPSGLPAGNWDAQVILFPTMQGPTANKVECVNVFGRLFAELNNVSMTANFFGCQAWGVKSGEDFDLGGITDKEVWSSGGVDCGSFVTQGPSRIIGMAVEITNTTAEIYRQGQVTVYRKPNVNSLRQTTVQKATTPASYNTVISRDVSYPAFDLSEANMLFGSRTWAAAEGAYIIGRQNGTDNPFTQWNTVPVTVPNPAPYPGQPPQATVNFFSTDIFINGEGSTPSFTTPFDISGAYFTGLSDQTTLNVTVRWIVERQPTIANPDLLVLATPSPGYDPLALEIYTRAMQHQPPGVKLSENPLGEWFKKVLKGVSDWAPRIGDALGTVIPGASTVGKIVGGGAKLLIPKEKPQVVPLIDSASHVEYIPQKQLPPKKKNKKISLNRKSKK